MGAHGRFFVRRVYPHVIQTELHPLNHDKYLIHYCRENGIVIQAHTPFARGGIMDQPMIRRTAALYGRPPTQV
jgi:diketogulonate reductase-like aldo/keto reductase